MVEPLPTLCGVFDANLFTVLASYFGWEELMTPLSRLNK